MLTSYLLALKLWKQAYKFRLRVGHKPTWSVRINNSEVRLDKINAQ